MPRLVVGCGIAVMGTGAFPPIWLAITVDCQTSSEAGQSSGFPCDFTLETGIVARWLTSIGIVSTGTNIDTLPGTKRTSDNLLLVIKSDKRKLT
jgi:hypothetical protein